MTARETPGREVRARAIHRPLGGELERSGSRHEQRQHERPATAPVPEKRDAQRYERNESIVLAQARDSIHRGVEEWVVSELNEGLRGVVETGELLAHSHGGQP